MNHPHQSALLGRVMFGVEAPATIYGDMRKIDARAKQLDQHMMVDVQDPATLTEWMAWLSRWKAFSEPYIGPNPSYSAKIAIITKTIEVRAATNDWGRQLEEHVRIYEQRKRPGAQPLPGTSSFVPPPQGSDPSLGLPWYNKLPVWLWVALGFGSAVGVGYLGYSGYRTLVGAKARADEGESWARRMVPGVLSPTAPARDHVAGHAAAAKPCCAACAAG